MVHDTCKNGEEIIRKSCEAALRRQSLVHAADFRAKTVRDCRRKLIGSDALQELIAEEKQSNRMSFIEARQTHSIVMFSF